MITKVRRGLEKPPFFKKTKKKKKKKKIKDQVALERLTGVGTGLSGKVLLGGGDGRG